MASTACSRKRLLAIPSLAGLLLAITGACARPTTHAEAAQPRPVHLFVQRVSDLSSTLIVVNGGPGVSHDYLVRNGIALPRSPVSSTTINAVAEKASDVRHVRARPT